MKGIYILAAILIALGALGYLALKDTDSDLTRRYEFLVSSFDTVETSLAEAKDPVSRLRRAKSTLRLDKELGRLRSRAGTMKAKLNAVRHGIETLSRETHGATSKTLERLRKEIDVLLLDSNRFTERVTVIDDFITKRKPLLEEVTGLLAAVQRAAAVKGGLSGELQDRLEKVTESTRLTVKQAGEALNEIWIDLDRGRTFAGRVLNDLTNCRPPLETLLKDLE